MIEKFFQSSLAEARDAASKVKEKPQQAELFALIAGISKEPHDFRAANEMIGRVKQSESRAVIIRKLAQHKKFSQAREMVRSIRAADSFWRAQALAWIALYSRQPDDFGQARLYASMINDQERKSDCLADIEGFEDDPEKYQRYFEDGRLEKRVSDPVASLLDANDFAGAHHLAMSVGNPYLRAHTFAIMAGMTAREVSQQVPA